MSEVLLITGSSGIAAATAHLWPPECPVFVLGADAASCAALCEQRGNAASFTADVTDEAAVREAVTACVARFGQIDAVFNVAGVSARVWGDGPLHECTAGGWDRAMDVNARGTFYVCREVIRVWLAAGQKGAILNTSSVLARHPEPGSFGTIGYAASKGAVEAMTLAAAACYAQAGIRINAIAPGLVDTPMTARARGNPQIMQFIERRQPLTQGMLSAEDVARAAVFLLRRESGPITGQIVTVDGGWSVG